MNRVHITHTEKREYGLRCPRCGGAADGATTLSLEKLRDAPTLTPGALVICGYCAAVNIYEKPLLRTLTRQERRAAIRAMGKVERELFNHCLAVAGNLRADRARQAN
jgi:Na+-transporting methylmalonyl-CoA/oxaloacetate decarboxylase beta subunit